MNDTLKFAIMLAIAALIWTLVNPITLAISVLVWGFSSVTGFGVVGTAVLAGLTALVVSK
jgi:hypothetical protein